PAHEHEPPRGVALDGTDGVDLVRHLQHLLVRDRRDVRNRIGAGGGRGVHVGGAVRGDDPQVIVARLVVAGTSGGPGTARFEQVYGAGQVVIDLVDQAALQQSERGQGCDPEGDHE